MRHLRNFLRQLFRLVDFGAALFLVVITILTFTAVVMRYVFSLAFPGSFDVARLLLGVAIFWGIAVAAYRKSHISVDLVWQALPRPLQRVVDVLADAVFAGFASLMAWTMLQQVLRVRSTGQTTFELSIPLWPFYATAWAGLVLCCVLMWLRVVAGIIGADLGGSQEEKIHDA